MIRCPKCNSDKVVKNGKSANKRDQKYLCRYCTRNFIETVGTVYYGSRLPKDKLDQIIHSRCEGNGIRATGRLCGVSKQTVARLVHKAGECVKAVNDGILKDFEPDEIQLDEAWTFVEKKS